MKPNKAINTGRKKRRSFVALLLAFGYGCRSRRYAARIASILRANLPVNSGDYVFWG